MQSVHRPEGESLGITAATVQLSIIREVLRESVECRTDDSFRNSILPNSGEFLGNYRAELDRVRVFRRSSSRGRIERDRFVFVDF